MPCAKRTNWPCGNASCREAVFLVKLKCSTARERATDMRGKLLIGVLLVLISSQAAATNLHDATGSFEDLLDLIKQNSHSWNGRLRGFATDLFWSLVVIQMVWKFGMLALKQPNWSEFSAEFFRFSVVVGVFHALLLYSAEWSGAIIDSFRQAGAHAAGVGVQLMPSDMFGLGVKLAKTVGDTQVGLDVATGIMTVIGGIIILLSFVFIAAFMQVTLIESYIVINASVFFMGFGGSEWTREYALAMWRYAVAVGAKLLVLTLFVGLILESAGRWQLAYNSQHDSASMWVMVGLAFVCAYLAKTIPDIIQGLITGVSVSGGSALGGMAAAMATGVAGGIALASAKMGGLGGLMSGTSGGVADLLKSSFTGGGSGGGSGGGYSSGMNSSPPSGGGSGGGGSSSRATLSRTGGGGSSFSGSSPAPSSAPTSPKGQAATSASAPKSGAVHSMADLAVRGMGTGLAIAMPGADSAAGLSVGPPPTPPVFDSPEPPQETPENIIRPAGQEPEAQPAPKTMAGLKESLNNHGSKA